MIKIISLLANFSKQKQKNNLEQLPPYKALLLRLIKIIFIISALFVLPTISIGQNSDNDSIFNIMKYQYYYSNMFDSCIIKCSEIIDNSENFDSVTISNCYSIRANCKFRLYEKQLKEYSKIKNTITVKMDRDSNGYVHETYTYSNDTIIKTDSTKIYSIIEDLNAARNSCPDCYNYMVQRWETYQKLGMNSHAVSDYTTLVSMKFKEMRQGLGFDFKVKKSELATFSGSLGYYLFLPSQNLKYPKDLIKRKREERNSVPGFVCLASMGFGYQPDNEIKSICLNLLSYNTLVSINLFQFVFYNHNNDFYFGYNPEIGLGWGNYYIKYGYNFMKKDIEWLKKRNEIIIGFSMPIKTRISKVENIHNEY